MLIYLLIYIPFVFCAYYDFINIPEKQKKTILWFWVIVFTLFRGLRWDIGTDWDQFFEVYNHAHWDNIFSYYRNETDQLMDYGYMFINALFHETGFSYTTFLLVTNFWIMWCYKDFSLRFSKFPILTFILLMSMGIPFPVRQTIATATTLWSCRFILERKWFIFILVSMIAALIHKGALIGLAIIVVLFIVDRWRIKWWGYMIAYASTFVIAEIFRDYISLALMALAGSGGQLAVYSDQYMQHDTLSVDYGDYNVSALSGLSYTLFFVLLIWIREKYNTICRSKIKHFEFFFFLYALAAIIDNIIRRGDSTGMTEILDRVTGVIDMLPIIFPLIFVVLLPHYIKSKLICFLFFFIYMLYKFWQQIPGSFFQDLFIPYKSVFEI